jgi:hypothetical protein
MHGIVLLLTPKCAECIRIPTFARKSTKLEVLEEEKWLEEVEKSRDLRENGFLRDLEKKIAISTDWHPKT